MFLQKNVNDQGKKSGMSLETMLVRTNFSLHQEKDIAIVSKLEIINAIPEIEDKLDFFFVSSDEYLGFIYGAEQFIIDSPVLTEDAKNKLLAILRSNEAYPRL